MAILKPIWIRSKCVSLQKFDIKSLICFHEKAAVATHKKRLISVERSYFWRFYLANTKGSFNECKQIIHEIDGGTIYDNKNLCEFGVFSSNNLNMRSSSWTIISRRLQTNKRILIEATQNPLMLSAVSIKLSCLVYTQFRVIMRLARSYQRTMKSFKRTQFRSPFLPLRSNPYLTSPNVFTSNNAVFHPLPLEAEKSKKSVEATVNGTMGTPAKRL